MALTELFTLPVERALEGSLRDLALLGFEITFARVVPGEGDEDFRKRDEEDEDDFVIEEVEAFLALPKLVSGTLPLWPADLVVKEVE